MEQKIKILRQEITASIIKDFDFKMNDTLSLCESEIEKLLLLHLYDYFKNYMDKEVDWLNEYMDLEFIVDEIWLQSYDREDRVMLEKKIKKKNYRKTSSSFYQKYIGFKVKRTTCEPFFIEGTRERDSLYKEGIRGGLVQEFAVYPQYNANIDGDQFRLDFAVVLNRMDYNNKVIDSRKIALECDGYDYHSSPEQKKNDDIRTRKLKRNGWKEVLRYSGKELFGLKNQNEIHSIFKEIVDILYL